MLAILGHLVTAAGVRLPGDIAYGVPFADMKAGLAAFETIPFYGTLQIIFFIGLIEGGFRDRKEEIEEAQLTASKWDQATIDKKMAIELNNGRAAQMGILALMVHEKLNNDPYVINTLLGAPGKCPTSRILIHLHIHTYQFMYEMYTLLNHSLITFFIFSIVVPFNV